MNQGSVRTAYQPLGASDHAYVLKLQPPAPEAPLQGRIEHIASGESLRFSSLEEMLQFLHQPHAMFPPWGSQA